MNQPNSLSKGLKTRHMTMISIAGVIGAGLFVGSGSVIHSTGPGAIVSYALAGLLVIFIMRMLGKCPPSTRQAVRFHSTRMTPSVLGPVLRSDGCIGFSGSSSLPLKPLQAPESYSTGSRAFRYG